MRFEITDDGSLLDDQSQERQCQISNATNMDQPVGSYDVTWRCQNGRQIKEKLSTSIVHDQKGDRHFLLVRQRMTPNGKPQAFEHCTDSE